MRNERRDFAILNKYPQRYITVLSQIGAHSNDEEVPGKGFYMIKTLPYRSKNANKFFNRLRQVMLKASEQDPLAIKSQSRVRLLPKAPVESRFKTAPKGLPIDFYSPQWFKELPPALQNTIPNTQALAFLPDASKSLFPKDKKHPNEKLADSTFTKKYWEFQEEPYGLLHESSDEEEPENKRGGTITDEEGEGIDLTQPSPDASDDDGFFAEGDAGDLYEEEEGSSGNESEEDGDYSEAEEDEGESEGTVDEDYPMQNIAEDEAEW